MDPSIVDFLATADAASLIAFTKTSAFMVLVGFMTIGVVEFIKELCKARKLTYPAELLPLPLVSAIVGALVMDVGLLVLGGSPLLLGRYTMIGLAAGFGATGLYGLKSAGAEPAIYHLSISDSNDGTQALVAHPVPSQDPPPTVIQVVHSVGDPPSMPDRVVIDPPPPAPPT